jgi:hypothetical protein
LAGGHDGQGQDAKPDAPSKVRDWDRSQGLFVHNLWSAQDRQHSYQTHLASGRKKRATLFIGLRSNSWTMIRGHPSQGVRQRPQEPELEGTDMKTYQVTMHRSEALSDEERQRRLYQAYLFILSLRPKQAHDEEELGYQAPPVSSDTLTEEPNLQAQSEQTES